MAAPTLVDETSGNITSSGTSHAITLPATVNAGDRLVAALTMRDSAKTNTWTWPAGWTELIDTTSGSVELSVSVAWRIADGTEDGGTVTVTSSSTEKATCKSWGFSGGGNVYATIGSLTNTQTPDPPNLAPGSGDWHWIALCVGEGNRVVSQFPSGYTGTGYLRPNVLAGDDATLGWARLAETGVSSEDPGTFTLSSTQQTYALTVGVIAAVPTITSITPATSATYPYPGELVTVAMTGYSSAPLSANCTLNGVGITLEAGATTSSCSFYAPALSTFVSGGTHAATRWNTNYTLTIANASDTANFTIRVTNPTLSAGENDFAQRAGTQTAYSPGASADGDDFYITWDYGGGTLSAATCYFAPTTLPARGQIRWYDVSAVSWQALAYTEVFSAPEVALELSKSVHYPDETVYRNELKFSNGFGNAVWTKTRSSAVWDATEIAPRGTGSWSITEDGTASNTHFFQSVSITPVESTVYTASVSVKASNRTQAAIGLTGAGNSDSTVIFNLSTGVFVATAGVAPTGYAISDEGNGWYRISMYWTATSSATMAMRVYAAASNSITFSGASQESILVADAQLETGSTAHDYVPTEMVPLRSDQVIVRSVAQHNLIGSPNDFSSGYWTKARSSIGGSITLNSNAANGWNGAVLWKIVEDTTASNNHYIQNITDSIQGNPAGLVTVRFLMAANIYSAANRRLAIVVEGDTTANDFQYRIDPATGTVTFSNVSGSGALHSCVATQVDTLTIEGDANCPVWEVVIRGWCSTTSDTAFVDFQVFLASTAGSTSYTGDGTSGVYVGKIQVVNGYTLPDYPSEDVVTAVAGTPTKDWDFAGTGSLPAGITFTRATVGTYYDSSGVLQEATSGTARFTHDPVTLKALGLLIEPSRTNSLRNNTMAGAVAGTPGTAPTNYTLTSGGGITRNIVGVGTENGIDYVEVQFSSAGANNFFVIPEPGTQIAAANGEVWTSTFYIRLIAGSPTNLVLDHNLQENTGAGAFLASTITQFTPTTAALSTQRNVVTRTLNNASTAYVQGYIRGLASGAYDITLRIGLPQLEKGSFATMPIKTSTVAVARNADVASLTGTDFSSWWNATNGTFWAEARTGNTIDSSATRRVLEVSDNTLNEFYLLGHSTTTNTRALVTDGGSTTADITQTSGIQAGTRNKLAFSYTANSIKHASNGTLGTTDTSATLPTVDRMHIGVDSASTDGRFLGGPISRICYWSSVLHEDILKQITGGYSTPFDSTISSATINGVAAAVAKDAIIRSTEDQSNATYWSKANIDSVTAEGVSADGYPAYKVDCNTTAGTHSIYAIFQKTLTDSSLVTLFADVKADERTFCALRLKAKDATFPGAYFNISAGTEGTNVSSPTDASIESRGNGWYRVRVVASVATGGSTPEINVQVAEADNDITFAGLGANDGILVSRVFAVEGNVAMADADAAYVKAGATMEHVLDRARAIVTMPGVDKFDASGTHAATRWNVAQDLEIGDGVTTDTGTMTFEPYLPDNFGTLTDGFNASAPTGSAVGDDGYIRIMSGDGTTVPALMDFTPSEASTIRRMVYDVSGSAWLAYTSESVTPTSPGDSSVIYSVIKNVVRSIQIQTVG